MPSPAPASPCETADEAELLRAARGGDRDAFGRLVELHQPRLHACLQRLSGSAEDARDIAQEAFVQAYLHLDSYQGAAAFFTWLCRIGFNLAASSNRRRRPRTSLDALRAAGACEPTASSESPETPAIRTEEGALVRQAINSLAEEHRAVIVLRELEGMDYQQIAEVLNVPVGTVRSRLFRARLQLRECLAPMFPEEAAAP